jgi:hypothetical protein
MKNSNNNSSYVFLWWWWWCQHEIETNVRYCLRILHLDNNFIMLIWPFFGKLDYLLEEPDFAHFHFPPTAWQFSRRRNFRTFLNNSIYLKLNPLKIAHWYETSKLLQFWWNSSLIFVFNTGLVSLLSLSFHLRQSTSSQSICRWWGWCWRWLNKTMADCSAVMTL